MSLAWAVVLGVIGIIDLRGDGRPSRDRLPSTDVRSGSRASRRPHWGLRISLRRTSSTSSRSPPRWPGSPSLSNSRRTSTTCCGSLLVTVPRLVRDLAGQVRDDGKHGLRVWPDLPSSSSSVALWQLHPDWSSLWHQRIPSGGRRAAKETPTYFYYGIALFGATMTPYEVFFFSSGAVEEKLDNEATWCSNRANVYLGFPLGGCAHAQHSWPQPRSCSRPEHHAVEHLSQVGLANSRSPSGRSVSALDHRRVLRRHLQRRARNGAVVRVHDRPSTSAGSGESSSDHWTSGQIPCGRAPLASIGAAILALTAIDPVKLTEYTDRALRRRAAADLLPDPGGRERPGLHGRQGQRPVSRTTIATLYMGHPDRGLDRHHPA